MTKKRLVENALNLPPDPDAPKAWTKEVDRRAREVREGAVKLADWKQVRKRIAASLRTRR